MLLLKWRNTKMLNLIGKILLANLILLYPFSALASEQYKDDILKKAGELMLDYQLNLGNNVEGEQRDLTSLTEAEALLTSALGNFKDDFDIVNRRSYVRILLRHYEDAIMDIEHLEALADQSWQGANSMKCMLLERLDRPESDYLPCYKIVVEKLKLMPNDFPFQGNVTYEIAFAATMAKDFATAEWALNELKKDPEVSQDVFDFYLESIDALKTKSGRKEVIYNTLP